MVSQSWLTGPSIVLYAARIWLNCAVCVTQSNLGGRIGYSLASGWCSVGAPLVLRWWCRNPVTGDLLPPASALLTDG
jgi:hypothetical protein